ncbi:unnamed protein product [Amoebophrya sp. A120]|nr:unnamed protein product [Amoebophrya sp. A120]|eukprot:GSA120T00001129001.1
MARFYVEDILLSKKDAENVTCPVCLHVWLDPVETTCSCRRIFCRSCIDPLLKCPVCRDDFSAQRQLEKYKSCGRFALSARDDLKVRCPNAMPATSTSSATEEVRTTGAIGVEPALKRIKCGCDEAKINPVRTPGCTWTGTYGDFLSKHIGECRHEVISCPRGCGVKFQRGQLTAHEAVCKKNFAECAICCELVKPDQMEEHNNLSAELHVSILQEQLAAADPLLNLSKRMQSMETSISVLANNQDILEKNIHGAFRVGRQERIARTNTTTGCQSRGPRFLRMATLGGKSVQNLFRQRAVRFLAGVSGYWG